MPHCTKCQRFHAPGQLNAFDNGWGELQLPGSLCECGDECSELDCISTCECEECPRTRYFWSPHLFWTSPGGLYENYESMYANGLGFYRYREGFVIDYENCTPLELKTFVKQRRIPDPCPKGLTLLFYYIKLLEADDRSPSVFRFMDLPAEMRNLVYEHLLIIPYDEDPSQFGGHCHPAILSTCREIHDEATDLLYTENEIKMFVHADWRRDHDGDDQTKKLFKTVHVQNHGEHNKESTPFEMIPDGIAAWPDYLRRVRKLSIEINLIQGLAVARDHGSWEFVQNCLSTLVAFLMDEHCLKYLDIHINYSAWSNRGATSALRQLERLKIDGHVAINGVGSFAQLITMTMRTPELKYPNIIKETNFAFNKADVLVDMLKGQYQSIDGEGASVVRGLIAGTISSIRKQRKIVMRSLRAEPEPGYGHDSDKVASECLAELQKILTLHT